MTHAKALSKINPCPERYSILSRTEIEIAIADITEAMKGPMSDLNRRLYHADRVDLRAALAKLQQREERVA